MRRISDELQGVAQALFRAQQNRLAAQVLARPHRSRQRRTIGQERFSEPAELEMRPPFRQPSGHAQRLRVVSMRVGTAMPCQVTLEHVERLAGATLPLQA
jgi:hypothetical protein